ncbi:MAG TPA: patatin-like phospholipase family protein [Solirubrobacterales bacterium]|nr:patatin-like phospholipase family protein [Solirubrobacterales bacterium]
MEAAPESRSSANTETKGLGLALSGGGFRASFFHVGVLARLAELGVLPKVEVISTVSGGSIVGALYYLRLRALLQSTPEEDLDDRCYVELVADVERRLRRGVQKNIRARVFANPLKNLGMLGPRYSRSDRIGDLYDRFLYKEAWGEERESRDFGRERQIAMRELLIRPPGAPDFHPDRDNAGRRYKVPILAINATSLNSGHNWRFEAVRMGEPLPASAAQRDLVRVVDKNMRLEQGYFYADAPGSPPDAHQIPDSQKDFPLALAVAASAAVPGVFHPLSISDLYEGIRVQLVDGGVQDNQGVQALLDQGCEQIVISDASGQMADVDKPAPFLPKALLRSSSIAQDRIRDEQLIDSDTRPKALIHLRMGLDAECVPPLGNTARREKGSCVAPGLTEYGADRQVQDLLSRIRTDLDYFSDTEALSLELDGYLIAKKEAGRLGARPQSPPTENEDWPFLALEEKLKNPDRAYRAVLRAGRRKFFRPFFLRPALIPLAAVIALGIAFGGLAAGEPLAAIFEGPWPADGLAVAAVLVFVPFAWANAKARLTWLYRR